MSYLIVDERLLPFGQLHKGVLVLETLYARVAIK